MSAIPLKWRRTGLAIGLLFLVVGCHRRPTINFRGLAPNITKIEEGEKPDPLIIYFDGSAARIEQIDKVVNSAVSISPAIPGDWKWESDKELVFVPGEDWAVGQEYTVKFGKKLFAPHVRVAKMSWDFETPKFGAEIKEAKFYLSPKNPNVKKIVATVKFTHPVATDEFEKKIQVEEKGLVFLSKTLPYTISYNKFKTEAYLQIEIGEIPQKDTPARITIDKGFGSSRGGKPFDEKLDREITVPGIFSVFRVSDAKLTLVRNDRYEPEQILLLNLTNPATEKDVQENFDAYLLPVDLPSVQGRPGRAKYYWNDVTIIGPEILAVSQKLPMTALPTAGEYSDLHSFKYTADVDRYVYLRLKKGTKSYGGYILADTFDKICRVPAFPKELNIMHDGAVLSLSGDRKLSILSRGLDSLRFQVERVLPHQVNHLVSQAGGQFKGPAFNNYNFDEKNITERFSEERTLELVGPGKTQYASFDFSTYLSNNDNERAMGLFFFRVESWDPIHKVSLGQQDSRLILITDLGLLVKDNKDGSHDIFVQSIRTGQAEVGVTVDILGKNGIAIATRQTGENGRVSFPNLQGMTDQKEPTVYVARKGQDLSFIPYSWNDRLLNISRFDVGGAQTQGSQEGLSAFLFCDRGLYRPGETTQIGMIVKPFNWNDDLNGVPLEAAIRDSRGLEVFKQRIRLSSDGFETLAYTTEELSPTGRYQVNLYTIKDNRRWNDLGSLSFRVEEFQPDRMRIQTRFSADAGAGWVSPEGLKAVATLSTMFGTPAEDRRVSAEIMLSPTYPSFRQYADYTFFDPLRAKRDFTEKLKEGRTKSDGEVEFELKLERFEAATYRAVFRASGFEADGGRSVGSESSILVSPLEYLIGFKKDGNFRFISKDSERRVHVVAIGPDLKPKAVKDLQVQLLRQQYVSVLTRQNDGTYKYESVLKEIPRWQKDIAIAQGGVDYALPTGEPGDFVLLIKDKDLNELIRIPFSIAGSANLTMNLEKNAELQIKLDKADYNPGEEIELQITAPYVGGGLITIERDRVYEQKWFKTDRTSTVQRIRVPVGIEGNAYVSVAFVRDIGSEEIFMSPLSYGVVPFSINRRKRTNEITITTSDLARPGEPFKIHYKTEQPGRIAIYAVDEGILQVAGYKLPDPLSFFFRKRALEVRTFQILDLILPEFRLVRALSAPGGGDEEGFAAIGKNLNPFGRKRDKPVVFWSGLLPSDGTDHEVTFNLPDYFDGTLRVMAVAVSRGTIGTFEKPTIVKGHFVLTPNVPSFVAPGDEFDFPVAVSNNVDGSGKDAQVNVALDASDNFEVIGDKQKTIAVPEAREKTVSFRLKVTRKLGNGTLHVTASREKLSSRRTLSVSIRPAAPYITTLLAGYFKDKTVKVPTPRRMYPHYRILEAAASPLPLVVARGLWTYLDNYPYEDTVTVVSRAVSAMALSEIPELTPPSSIVQQKLDNAFRMLMARQNGDGAFGYWAANSHASSFESVFAMHFLTEAQQRGQAVPEQVHAKGIAFLRNLAGSLGKSLEDSRLRAYAVYVLTRNGVVTTNYLETLRNQLDKNFPNQWQQDLTGIYLAGAYKMMKQDGPADSLIRAATFGGGEVQGQSRLIRECQLLMVLSLHFPDRLRVLKPEDLVSIVDPVSKGYYDTLTSAEVIWALSTYAKRIGPIEPATVSIHEILEGAPEKALTFPKSLFPKTPFSPDATSVHIESDLAMPIFYSVTQAGFDLEAPKTETTKKMEVFREFQDAQGKPIVEAKLGDEIQVHIKIRTIEKIGDQSVVVVDLFPAGFELVQDSVRGKAPASQYETTERDASVASPEGETSGDAEGEGDTEEGDVASSRSTDQHDDATPSESAQAALPGWLSYVDAREDRVVLFGNVGENVSEYVYRLKATNRGDFSIPPLFAESRYDRNFQALGIAGKMKVTE